MFEGGEGKVGAAVSTTVTTTSSIAEFPEVSFTPILNVYEPISNPSALKIIAVSF